MTPSEGRKFGLTVGAAFGALGGLLLWRGHEQVAIVLLVAAGLLLSAGIAVPTRLGSVERAWMGMALAISKVTTPILMSVVYFLVMAPVGLLRRAFGGNPLRQHGPRDSNWVEHKPSEHGDLRRQF